MASKKARIKTYRAAPGAPYNNAEARIIGRHLEKIGRGKPKDVMPEIIVEDARDKKSPLHKFFTWDDDAAATAYRLWQARLLVNHLRVVIITDKGEVETKAFHSIVVQSDSDGTARVYRPVLSMTGPSQEDARRQVLESALQELESWRRRYAEYENVFGEVFAAIDRALTAESAA